MKRVLILVAILLFGIGFEAAAATPLSEPVMGVYAAKFERPKPRRKRVRRHRRTGTYIPYLRNSVPIPYLRLSPAMRRKANRQILEALIN